MTPEERAFLERARVGRLATADGEGNPHAVPVCYALVGGENGEKDGEGETDRSGETDGEADPPGIVTPVDEKPKSTRDLRRVRDVRANPRVALVVDRYEEDWSRLAWVQVRGRARVIDPGAGEPADPDPRSHADPNAGGHEKAVRALRAKYDQYADHALEDRPVVEIEVGRTLSWGAVELEP